MIRTASLLVLLAFTAAAPATAHADAKVEAKARMERATTLYQEGKYAEALNELTIAYTLDPKPEMLYAIGQMHVQLGNCPQAILFYERFLSTNPDSVPAAAAAEAIETCRQTPDAVGKTEPTPPTEPAQPPPPQPEQPPPPVEAAPVYGDKIVLGLAVGGVALGLGGLGMYLSAKSDLGKADDATDYKTHADHVDSARSKRTIAAVLGAVGVGIVGAAATRFVLLRRATNGAAVGVAPAAGGGMVTWSGRF